VTGGGTAVTAYNSVSVSGNDIVFGKTDGTGADTQPLGGLTAITDLQTLTTGHTTAIDNIESREQFKTVTQHPDVTDNQMTSGTFTSSNTRYDFSINGINYGFANSSSEGTNYSYVRQVSRNQEKTGRSYLKVRVNGSASCENRGWGTRR